MLERSGPRDVHARSGLLRSGTGKGCLSPSVRSYPLRPGTGRGPASPKPRPSPVAAAQTDFDAPLGLGALGRRKLDSNKALCSIEA